jgi:hypothetical protein
VNLISPLNFAGLVARARGELEPAKTGSDPMKRRRSAIECWKCPECYEVYEDEDEAEQCCQGEECSTASPLKPEGTAHCPVCNRSTELDYHEAVTCCLWKDIGPFERYAIATLMERGTVTWAEALEPYLPQRIAA